MRALIVVIAMLGLSSSALAARQTLNGKVKWIRAYQADGTLQFTMTGMAPCTGSILVLAKDAPEALPLLLQAKAIDQGLRITTDDQCTGNTCQCKVSAIEFM